MANTINTGTMLIEEGALMPESLRFESEPWTPFYLAGEVIRELRKVSENKKNDLCPSNEKRPEEGGLKDDQLQRPSPAQTSNRRCQLLPNNAPG